VKLNITPKTSPNLSINTYQLPAPELSTSSSKSPRLSFDVRGKAALLKLNSPVTEFAINPTSNSGVDRKSLIALGVVTGVLVASLGGFGYVAWDKQSSRQQIEMAGFELNDDGLLEAIVQERSDIVKLFQKWDIRVQSTPRVIEAAVVSQSPLMLSLVLKEGALLSNEPNLENLIFLAIDSGNEELLDQLIDIVPVQAEQVADIYNKFLRGAPANLLLPLSKSPEIKSYTDLFGHTLIHYASLFGNATLLDQLNKIDAIDLNSRNSNGQTALHLISDEEKFDVAQWLILKGLDPLLKDRSGQSALQIALESSDDELVAEMARNSEQVATLLASEHIDTILEKGMTKVMGALVERAWSPNELLSNGLTPLAVAASSNNLESVLFLIDRGAMVNQTFVVNQIEGVTALMFAALNGHQSVVAQLLAKGADPQLVASNGVTASSLAYSRGHISTFRLMQ